jgi:hypothetical protein
LEDLSRESAVAELRRAWASFTDQEVALMMVPYANGIREPTPEESEVEERARAAMPEELIARAIGLKDGAGDEEVDRRISNLVRSLGIFERGDNIRRHMLASSIGGDE